MYRRLRHWVAKRSEDPAELRRAPAVLEPGEAVYHWNSSATKRRVTGACLYTDGRCYCGTIASLLNRQTWMSPSARRHASTVPDSGCRLRYPLVWSGPDPTAARSGVTNAGGPGINPALGLTIVKDFAGALATGKLAITANYPDGSNAPGQPANVMLIYPDDPLTTWFPFLLSLGSAAQEVIAF